MRNDSSPQISPMCFPVDRQKPQGPLTWEAHHSQDGSAPLRCHTFLREGILFHRSIFLSSQRPEASARPCFLVPCSPGFSFHFIGPRFAEFSFACQGLLRLSIFISYCLRNLLHPGKNNTKHSSHIGSRSPDPESHVFL